MRFEFKNNGDHYEGLDVKSFVYINHDEKLIYFNNTKCASTSIKHILQSNRLGFKREIFSNDYDYRKFAVVRDPIDRAISFVTQYLGGSSKYNYGGNDIIFKNRGLLLHDRIITVMENVIGDPGFDIHCQPQVWKHTDEDNNLIEMDYLIPFLNMSNCFETMFRDHFGMKINARTIKNVSDSKLRHLVDQHIRANDEYMKSIKSIYAYDFVLHDMAKKQWSV